MCIRFLIHVAVAVAEDYRETYPDDTPDDRLYMLSLLQTRLERPVEVNEPRYTIATGQIRSSSKARVNTTISNR
jgi:hypothetical protein